MFDIGWSEMTIVVVVACIVIGPKDWPVVLKTLKNWMHQLQTLKNELSTLANNIVHEVEIMDTTQELQKEAVQINNKIRQIVDLEGNLRDAYDMSDIRPDIKKEYPTEEKLVTPEKPLS